MSGSAAYVSSKYAIRGLVRVAALELARDNIRVNAICPGTVDTAMLRSGHDAADALAPIARQVPMRRVADPHEIATAVAFLLGNDSSYITGTDLIVDGGVTARLPLNLSAR
jgi:3alpha(or 20beta)-hydroxysteroid dehydrogenase